MGLEDVWIRKSNYIINMVIDYMVNFDEFVVMKKGFLKKLNIAIDEVINEKEDLDIDYDLLEKALELMIKNNRPIGRRPISVVVPIKKSDMLTVTLDFFRSIDIDFYKKAIDTILQQNNNIKMNLYNFHDIRDFNKRDNNNLLEYTPDGRVHSRNGCANVNIPTNSELNSREEEIFEKDTCTLEDLYTIVHEITHLFDLDLEAEKIERRKNMRELTGEATTIGFEGLLTEYLLKNNLYSSIGIQQIVNKRYNSSMQNARLVYAKLLLAKEKSKKGEITLEFIEKLMRDNNLSTQYVRKMAYNIISATPDMLLQNRYAIGGFIAPTIVKAYKENGVQVLKKYLEYAKNNDIEQALKAIGVEMNIEGINILDRNFNEYLNRISEKER